MLRNTDHRGFRNNTKMFKASKIIKYVTTSQGKQIAIDFVTHTDKWERKTLASSVKDDFVAVVEKKYKDTLDPEVVKVAIK